MNIELLPHRGAGLVRFGMRRDEVRQLLGEVTHSGPSKDFFAHGALHVHYTSLMVTELIVVTADFGAIIDGVDVLHVPAEDALAAVARVSAVDLSDAEYPLSCTFLGIDVNLWRSCLPEDNAGSAGRQFEAVGVGVAGYYSRHRPG